MPTPRHTVRRFLRAGKSYEYYYELWQKDADLQPVSVWREEKLKLLLKP